MWTFSKWEDKKGCATWIQRQTERRRAFLLKLLYTSIRGCFGSARTNYKRFSLFCKGPITWNKISPCIREAKTLASFKKAWKQFLILEGEVYRIDRLALVGSASE